MRGSWTKKMFIIGAILDGLVAIVMLTPRLEAFALGFDEPVLDPDYRFAMTFGAALMVGWTALLVWAAAKPVERRAVAPLTMLVVVGLMSAEYLGMTSGFLPALHVWALLGFQMALLVTRCGRSFQCEFGSGLDTRSSASVPKAAAWTVALGVE